MAIYFSATITNDAEAKARYERVFAFLKKEGYAVLGYKQEKLTPTELTDRAEQEMKDASKMRRGRCLSLVFRRHSRCYHSGYA